jgi:uronate dehydrogenase
VASSPISDVEGARKLRVLLTGAAGRIGRHLVAPMARRYDLTVLDRAAVPGVADALRGDLQDPTLLERACAGVEVVAHLAAVADESPFLERLLPSNIVGCYRMFEAARRAGVRRVVFASSCEAFLGQHGDLPIDGQAAFEPVGLYGASKAFGELLAQCFGRQGDLEVVCLRLGWFQPYGSPLLQTRTPEPSLGHGARDLWLSPGDAFRLFRCAIEKRPLRFVRVFGTSITEREVLSLAPARRELGYEPLDSVTRRWPMDDLAAGGAA